MPPSRGRSGSSRTGIPTTNDLRRRLPLSDHADFNELVAFAERCGAGTIPVTHGSRRFAEELRRRGIRAEFINGKPQMRLF